MKRLDGMGFDPLSLTAAVAGPAASIFSTIFGSKVEDTKLKEAKVQLKAAKQAADVQKLAIAGQQSALQAQAASDIQKRDTMIYEIVGVGTIVIASILIWGAVKNGPSPRKVKKKEKKHVEP